MKKKTQKHNCSVCEVIVRLLCQAKTKLFPLAEDILGRSFSKVRMSLLELSPNRQFGQLNRTNRNRMSTETLAISQPLK